MVDVRVETKRQRYNTNVEVSVELSVEVVGVAFFLLKLLLALRSVDGEVSVKGT